MVKKQDKQPGSRSWQGAQRVVKTLPSLTTGQAGVTLIELLVVIAIVGLVSSVLLFNYSDFKTNVSIRNLSQDVALSIRKAQIYATSVQVTSNAGAPSYPSYGIVFSLESGSQTYYPNSKKFIIFADLSPDGVTPPNKIYNSGGTVCGSISVNEECLELISIVSADSLIRMETDVSGVVASGTIAITFRRPSPDAIICYIPSGQTDCVSTIPSYAKLVFRSANGLQKTVSVWNTGQINVE